MLELLAAVEKLVAFEARALELVDPSVLTAATREVVKLAAGLLPQHQARIDALEARILALESHPAVSVPALEQPVRVPGDVPNDAVLAGSSYQSLPVEQPREEAAADPASPPTAYVPAPASNEAAAPGGDAAAGVETIEPAAAEHTGT